MDSLEQLFIDGELTLFEDDRPAEPPDDTCASSVYPASENSSDHADGTTKKGQKRNSKKKREKSKVDQLALISDYE